MSGRLLSRTVAHLSLVGLVAISVVLVAGLRSSPQARHGVWPAGLRLIAAAYAAERPADRATSWMRYALDPQPHRPSDETAPDRAHPRAAPSSTASLPAPI